MDAFEDDFEDIVEPEDEIDPDELWDLVHQSGQKIVSLFWDGDGPAHSGEATIYRYDGQFYFDCEVEGLIGPIATLEDALDRGGFHFPGTPNPELHCDPELQRSSAILHAAYDLAGEPGGVVLINGDAYIRLGHGVLALRDPGDGSLTTIYVARDDA